MYLRHSPSSSFSMFSVSLFLLKQQAILTILQNLIQKSLSISQELLGSCSQGLFSKSKYLNS